MSIFSSFDLSRYPIIIVTLNGSPKNEKEFEDYLLYFKKLYEKKEKFSLIIDSRNVGWIPFYYLYRQAAFLKEIEPLSKKYLYRTAIVITSTLADIFLKTIFGIKPPVTLTDTFDDLDTAIMWISQT